MGNKQTYIVQYENYTGMCVYIRQIIPITFITNIFRTKIILDLMSLPSLGKVL